METKIRALLLALLVLAAQPAPAQTCSIIYSFTNAIIGRPVTPPVIAGDLLYGTTPGSGDVGCVFKLKTDGTDYALLVPPLNTYLHTPITPPVLVGSTLFYATTPEYQSAANAPSLLFRVGTDGSDLACIGALRDGAEISLGGNAAPGLVLSGNTLYGTAAGTADGSTVFTNGEIFKINVDGSGFAVLHAFTNTPDGAMPYAGLVLDGSTLYGTTRKGGSLRAGTVFSVQTNGTGFTILHSFAYSTEGAEPGQLIVGPGVLYGITSNGGKGYDGTLFKMNKDGTGFAVLRTFGLPQDPGGLGSLVLRGNTVYGITYSGGALNLGAVVQIGTDGTGYTVLHSFAGSLNGGDGAKPTALAAGPDALYGVTYEGGRYGYGTVFKLVPPAPTLLVTTVDNTPVVFWPDDGFSRTLETTTNGASGQWSMVTNGVPVVGVQVTNFTNQPNAFFRLR